MKFHFGRREERTGSQRLLRDDPKFASGKIAVFQYLAVGIFIFLLASFWDLPVNRLDTSNWFKSEDGSHE